jgi:hypothetical protein
MDLAPQGLITQQQKANERRPVGSSQIWTVCNFLIPCFSYYLGILNKIQPEIMKIL